MTGISALPVWRFRSVRPQRLGLPSRRAPARRAPDRRMWVGLDARREPSALICRVRAYVEAHMGEIQTVDELADVARLSRRQLDRRFHAETGEAPWAFLRRTRDAEAARRLATGAPPAEVAFALGYADQAHLTRSLRARTGRTPGAIRAEGAPAESESAAHAGDAGAPDGPNVQDGAA